MHAGSPVVVGRATELGMLKDALHRAREYHSGAVFLVADAGLGKSRLVQECAAYAAAAGSAVLRGRATPATATIAYRPLAEALFSQARSGGVPDDPVLAPYRPALSRLVPEWRNGRALDNDDSPVVLAEGVLRLLSAIGQDRGALICLSDLHDVDAETLDVVEYLVDNLADQPVMLLASMRSVPSPALALARRCVRHRVGMLIELPPLADAEVCEMAAALLGTPLESLPTAMKEWLIPIADGNPFVVEEMLRGIVDSGVLKRCGDGEGAAWTMAGNLHVDLPSTVVESVSDRARRLGPRWHRALEAAAVIGRRFPLDVLRQVSGLEQDELHALVRAGIGAQLLEPSETSPGWYSFRSALIAEALSSTLLPAERAAISAAAADAVQAASPDLPGELCQLVASLRLASGDCLAAGLRFAEAGRRALAEGMAASAVRLLDHALELVPETNHANERANILASLLYALAEAGDVDRALRLSANLTDSILLSPQRRAELHTRLAWVCVVGGQWVTAAQQVSMARALLGSQGSEVGLVPVDVVEAHLLTLSDAVGEDLAARAEELALRAARRAEEAAMPAVACQARQILALLTRRRGFDAADVHLGRMLEIADRHGLSIWRLRAQIRLATNELMRIGRADQLLQARRAALALGAVTAGLQADATFAIQQVLYGQYEDAERLANEIFETTARMRQMGEAQFAVVIKIAAAAHQGRRDAMRRAEALFRSLGGEQSFHAPIVFGHRAICAVLGEDRPAAEAEIARIVEWERTHPTIYYQSGRYGFGVLLEALAGRIDPADHARVHSVPAADLRWNRQFVQAAEAVLLGRAGRTGKAGAAMSTALESAAPFPMARHLLLRLVAEAALNDGWGEPVTWLRAAEEYFHTADVAPIAGACRALLRRAGVRVMQRRAGSSAVPSYWAERGVTSREFEVLTLLAERRPNLEIARLLFISPRTVEKHVASLLTKLDRPDRNSLSALVASRGL